MNRTLKDFLVLFSAMWVVFFINNLINPNAKNKDQLNAGFIGIAYVIGRRPDKPDKGVRKPQAPQKPSPPIQYGEKR